MDAITLVLLALSTARLTRLSTTDKVTEWARALVMRRLDPDGMLAYLVHCDWCASIWIGAGVSGAWQVFGDTRTFNLAAVALAISYVAGFLNSKVED